MAAVIYAPVLPLAHSDMSDTSSPHSTATSSESPRTVERMSFAMTMIESPVEQDMDVVLKIEELEEDELDQTKPLPSPPEEEELGHNADQTLVKRPRGRPRKHPKEPPSAVSKTLKGRSKTGCITCRRRKKKCDETKPACTTPVLAYRHICTATTQVLTSLTRPSLPAKQCTL